MEEPENEAGDQPATPATGRERRTHKRYPVEGWAEVMTADGTLFVRGQISDISSAGCYIDTRAASELMLNCVVEIVFRINGAELRPEAVTRLVMPGDGVGFAFLKMNARLQAQLAALIEVLSGHLGQSSQVSG